MRSLLRSFPARSLRVFLLRIYAFFYLPTLSVFLLRSATTFFYRLLFNAFFYRVFFFLFPSPHIGHRHIAPRHENRDIFRRIWVRHNTRWHVTIRVAWLASSVGGYAFSAHSYCSIPSHPCRAWVVGLKSRAKSIQRARAEGRKATSTPSIQSPPENKRNRGKRMSVAQKRAGPVKNFSLKCPGFPQAKWNFCLIWQNFRFTWRNFHLAWRNFYLAWRNSYLLWLNFRPVWWAFRLVRWAFRLVWWAFRLVWWAFRLVWWFGCLIWCKFCAWFGERPRDTRFHGPQAGMFVFLFPNQTSPFVIQ